MAKEINVEVYAQGDKVKTLDRVVEEAQTNVKDGNEELEQAEKHQKSGCKWLAVCLIILVIIIVIICISLFS